MAGVEFEYLQSTLWHFPSIWEPQIAGKDSPSNFPDYGNYRLGIFVQGQAQIGKWASIHASVRLDVDERVGATFSPQGGVVITPGAGTFIKLHYALGYRTPSLYELYFFEDGRYGNPQVFNETIHNIGLQAGWMKKNLLYVALNAYVNIINDPIRPVSRAANEDLRGSDGDYTFLYPTPKPTGPFTQLENRIDGITSFGGEIEARLFPTKGFEIIGHFGLAISTEVYDAEGNADRVPYAAGIYTGLSASYRYKAFRISLGFLYVGSKIVPNTPFNIPNASLPANAIKDATSAQALPSWNIDQNPRAPTPDDIQRVDGYVRVHLTLQLLRIFNHLDFAIRAQNFTGLFLNSYDAYNPLLLPQKRFELLAWMKYHY